MAYEKMARLIKELHIKTMDGKLKWIETPDENIFQVALANHSIVIGQEPDEDDGERLHTYISIRDTTGREIEKVYPGHLVNTEDMQILGVAYPVSIFRDIYEQARRIALGVEKSVTDILDELKQSG